MMRLLWTAPDGVQFPAARFAVPLLWTLVFAKFQGLLAQALLNAWNRFLTIAQSKLKQHTLTAERARFNFISRHATFQMHIVRFPEVYVHSCGGYGASIY
ncbi:uncharacterized protein BYT42DRAFT_590217 [Radiomyces spectabilis]|uniref:uncharacterized protein n=1 Tax=Radiomyces spectabilis TaxID=64574 RepID=UPI00221EE00A|nr:uncharacterized protein BYT42DRAFT_590217 [Radiomyces spectabilis]KAI8364739.1 hypothetical protein BYT42DRAFT_590217 [Radiomyces spectabilis]